MSNFRDVFKSLTETGGATYNYQTGELNPTKGYAVAYKQYNKKVYGADILTYEGLSEVFREWVNHNDEITTLFVNKPYLFVGLWIENKTLFIDVVKIIPDLQKALRMAQEEEQRAIYDLELKHVINVPLLAATITGTSGELNNQGNLASFFFPPGNAKTASTLTTELFYERNYWI